MTDATLKDTKAFSSEVDSGSRKENASRLESSVRRRISLPAIPVSVALAVAWIIAMLLIAAFAEKIAPYSFTQLDLRNRLAAPGNAAHWLGTDELELSLKVGDGGNREGGISWGCLTPPLLHRRSDMPCPTITSPS
ncbi:hypothetical protein ACVIU7_009262 [Bradyrhizobium liaoningense]